MTLKKVVFEKQLFQTNMRTLLKKNKTTTASSVMVFISQVFFCISERIWDYSLMRSEQRKQEDTDNHEEEEPEQGWPRSPHGTCDVSEVSTYLGGNCSKMLWIRLHCLSSKPDYVFWTRHDLNHVIWSLHIFMSTLTLYQNIVLRIGYW